MKRRLIIGFTAIAVAAGTYAAAAALNVTTHSLGAGSAPVSSCDTDGVDTLLLQGYRDGSVVVQGIRVNGIAIPACQGKYVTAALHTASGEFLAQGGGQIGGGGATHFDAMLTTPVPAAQVGDVDVVIQG